MANVKKSVPFNPEILEEELAEKGMSLNELAFQIAKKNNITKQAEMTSLRRYKRNKEISLSALEDIGEILDLDPNIFRKKEITSVYKWRENQIRPANDSDQTYQRYLERSEAEDQLNITGLINKESLDSFLSTTPFYIEIQKMDELHHDYYLYLLSIEIQRLMYIAINTEVKRERVEIQGKTTRIEERFKVINKPKDSLPHPEDYYVSKKR
ncbi:MAG: hypothetical protein IKE06_04355 [Solobacterium sp.]|nr:hypothetical protein [Solobacterium sp.]